MAGWIGVVGGATVAACRDLSSLGFNKELWGCHQDRNDSGVLRDTHSLSASQMQSHMATRGRKVDSDLPSDQRCPTGP